MSVCKACGSTKLTELPCPECGWPILPPAETPPAPVDVPARLREKAEKRQKWADLGTIDGSLCTPGTLRAYARQEARLLDLLADTSEVLIPCHDAGYDGQCPTCSLIQRIEEAAR